jgi:DNA-binding MarR family transcriptional regulator
MTELANRILANKSGLTRVIDRMEAEGLVRRERHALTRVRGALLREESRLGSSSDCRLTQSL